MAVANQSGALVGYNSGSTRYQNTEAYAVALQQEIARQNGGRTLELPAIYAQLSNEGQSPAMATDTNPLNIPFTSTVGGSYYASRVAGSTSGGNTVFTNPQAGIEATAYFLLHVGWYSGIRATMAPAGQGNAVEQATAIQNSPWAGSHYGYQLANHVQRILAVAGAAPSWVTKGAGNFTVDPNAPTPAPSTEGKQGTLAAFLGKDGTLQLADVPAIAAQIAATDFAKSANWTSGDIHAYLVDFVGHKYSDIPLNVSDPTKNIDASGPASGTPFGLPNIQLLPPQALAFIVDPANWVYLGALAIGTYFAVSAYRHLGSV